MAPDVFQTQETLQLTSVADSSTQVFLDDSVQSRDQALHWWCVRRLRRNLRLLVRVTHWRGQLVDLQRISWLLEKGCYEDEDGFIDPELFWSDVRSCCHSFPEVSSKLEALEGPFWLDLEQIEQSIEIDPTFGAAATAFDATSSEVADVVHGLVVDGVQGLACWLRGEVDRKSSTDELSMHSDSLRDPEIVDDKLVDNHFTGGNIAIICSLDDDFAENNSRNLIHRSADCPDAVNDQSVVARHFLQVFEARFGTELRPMFQEKTEEIDRLVSASFAAECLAKHEVISDDDDDDDVCEFPKLSEKVELATLLAAARDVRHLARSQIL